jgi:hypothetical protein
VFTVQYALCMMLLVHQRHPEYLFANPNFLTKILGFFVGVITFNNAKKACWCHECK